MVRAEGSGRRFRGTTVIKAVFFDFAGTLFSDRDLRDVHLEQLRFVGNAAGVDAPDRQLRRAYREGMAQSFRQVGAHACYSHRALFGGAYAGMAIALGAVIDAATAQEAVDRQYRATIANAALRPDVVDTLNTLRDNGIGVHIVSNIDDELFEPMLDRLRLRPLIDGATSSESAGSCKPDRRIFEVALARAGCAAGQGLFVGDSPVHDVAGPATLGMHTAWLAADGKHGVDGATPNFVIDRISDVVAVLTKASA